MKKIPALLLCIPVVPALAACAPSFHDLPRTVQPALVERPVMVEQGVLEPQMRREQVLASHSDGTPRLTRLGPVRWFDSGADERTQPPPKQMVGKAFSEVPDSPKGGGSTPLALIPDSARRVLFPLDKDWKPTPEANALTTTFRAAKNANYEVRFLYSGPLDPVAAHETTATWTELAQRLVGLGAIEPDQLRSMSARYNQPQNAIALLVADQEVNDR